MGKLTRVRRPRGRPAVLRPSVAGVADPEAAGVDAAVLPAAGVAEAVAGVAPPRTDLRRAGVSFSVAFWRDGVSSPWTAGARCGNMPWFNSGRACSTGASLGISVTSRMLTRECVVRIGRCCGFCGSSSSVRQLKPWNTSSRLITSNTTSSPISGVTEPTKMWSPIFRKGCGVSSPFMLAWMSRKKDAYDKLIRRLGLEGARVHRRAEVEHNVFLLLAKAT